MRKTAILQLIAALFLISTSANLSAGQTGSVTITPRRVVLKRSPKLAREFPERKTAVVRYPTVHGLDNPQALQKLQSLLAIKNVFGTTLNEYREDAWLTEFDYRVGYNKNNLLDITFSQSGMGSYPDTQTKHLLINLKTGSVITGAEAFDRMSTARLARLVDAKLQAEIREIIKGLAGDKELDNEQRESLKSSFAELKFKEENLDEFEVSNTGLTFLFDAGFPHVIQALQPDGRYFMPFSALQGYIKRDGPLAVLLSGK